MSGDGRVAGATNPVSTGAGTLLRAYEYGPGADEAVIWYEYTSGFSRRFLHADHQGSIVAVTDTNGAALAINAYDEYGIPKLTGLEMGRFGYTGQAWIPELGLNYYKARIYSPTLGRFLQTDPVGYADQMNLYAYVGNDPVNRFDTQGAWSATVHERIFELALAGRVTGAQLNWIEHVSLNQDIGPNKTHMEAHFLRNPGDDARAARAATQAYINREVQTGAKFHNQGNEKEALAAFTRAAHALQDSYSPVHNKGGLPAVYKDLPGPELSDALLQGHSPTDNVGGEGTDDMTPAARDAMVKGTTKLLDRIRNCDSHVVILGGC